MQILTLEKRVLIVDDETNIALLLQRSLARSRPELKIEVAGSGIQALEFLKGESFDLIITDYNMPHMNGLTLIQAIRQNHPETKIILTTAYHSSQIMEQSNKLAVDGYFVKPFSTRLLREKVRQLLVLPELIFPDLGGNGHGNREDKDTHC